MIDLPYCAGKGNSSQHHHQRRTHLASLPSVVVLVFLLIVDALQKLNNNDKTIALVFFLATSAASLELGAHVHGRRIVSRVAQPLGVLKHLIRHRGQWQCLFVRLGHV